MVPSHILHAFVGAWTLINITRTQNGHEITDTTYGKHATGTIMYTASGYMTALLTATDPVWRPESLTLPAEANQTDAEWALVGKHSLAYSGPFFINSSVAHNATNGEIVHGPLRDSTLPAFVHSYQRRTYAFYDGSDTLSLVGNLGNGIVDSLWWTRVERH